MGTPDGLTETLVRVASLEATKHRSLREMSAPVAIAFAATGAALVAMPHLAPGIIGAHAGLAGAATHAHGMAVTGLGTQHDANFWAEV